MAALCLLPSALVLLAGCEKPDASFTTSPSLRALVGTTAGNVVFHPVETPPTAVEPPPGWEWELGLARFTKLENEQPALQVVMQVNSRPGAGIELWLSDSSGVIVRWTAGSTAVYGGVVCFQLLLEKDGQAVPLGTAKHQLTVAFREPEGNVVTAKTVEVKNTTPKLTGGPPAPGSEVFRTALSCPRGS
ncbi:MAG: hypothetical protein ABIP13_06340 [Tepidiformaceae bacterium]